MNTAVSGRARVHRVQCSGRQAKEAALSALQKDLFIKGFLGTSNRPHWWYLWILYTDHSRTDISQEHSSCDTTSGNLFPSLYKPIAHSYLHPGWKLLCHGICRICGHDVSPQLRGGAPHQLRYVPSRHSEKVDELVRLLWLRLRPSLAVLRWVQHHAGCRRSLHLCGILCRWICWICCKLM